MQHLTRACIWKYLYINVDKRLKESYGQNVNKEGTLVNYPTPGANSKQLNVMRSNTESSGSESKTKVQCITYIKTITENKRLT